MQPKTKKVVIIGVSVAIIGGIVWYVYAEHQKQKKKIGSEPTAGNLPTEASTTSTSDFPAAAPMVSTPSKSTVSAGPVKPATVKPISQKGLSADELIQKNGENAIIGKTLVAKSSGAGIYNTINQKVSVTNTGERLGKAFKATRMQVGNYMIKYQDNSGNYRVVASSSVNVI